MIAEGVQGGTEARKQLPKLRPRDLGVDRVHRVGVEVVDVDASTLEAHQGGGNGAVPKQGNDAFAGRQERVGALALSREGRADVDEEAIDAQVRERRERAPLVLRPEIANVGGAEKARLVSS